MVAETINEIYKTISSMKVNEPFNGDEIEEVMKGVENSLRYFHGDSEDIFPIEAIEGEYTYQNGSPVPKGSLVGFEREGKPFLFAGLR